MLEAYCLKCKEKREIVDPVAEYNAAGAPVTRGRCAVCGGKVYRTGRTSAHEGLPPPEKGKKNANKRSGKLVIVESPAKARTVGRFLGKEYTVKASIGHVRDLLRSQLSVDVDNDFTPQYRVPNEKRPVVKELKELARRAEKVYLATDPDREGEAIAWHLMEAVEIEPQNSQRVVFHEITEPAIAEAFGHPRSINMNLVNAQQARRVLDRLVGYSISPILWEKVRSRLSAGRVQSVALRLIVEREREIEAFVPVEYWAIGAELKPENGKTSYLARLTRVDDAEPQLPTEGVVLGLLEDLESAAYAIRKIQRGERRRKPAAPFITSTLQQETSRRLGYTARRTMALAQQLYEGVDVGEGGTTGLITYMRTDSTNIAEQALSEVRQYIQHTYGGDFLPETPPQYKTRAKSAQEAHEAIRPTAVLRQPDTIKEFLSRDQFRLYQLIWQRFVASQMEAAVYDTLAVDILAESAEHRYNFRASGSTIRFPGFLVVYEESRDEDQKVDDADDVRIPPNLEEGQRQELIRLIPEQHFTQPPPRYTEATLVQTLEEYGIGRPSTYAPILSTGFLVSDLLVEHFPNIVDTNFTAHMESDLDNISTGEDSWVDVVRAFYQDFAPQLERAQQEMPTQKAELEKIGRACPECGHDLVIRWGRFGKFISCSNFPACRYTEPWLEKIGVACPQCGKDLIVRKTRKGRIFYGCSGYPECQFTSWKQPVATPCPNCGGLLVIVNKREMKCLTCEETFLSEAVEEASSEQA